MKIRRRMGETKQIVQVNGGNILLFELASRLLTLPLLLQAVAALFRLSVRASGYSYVTVSNLVSYLLRPVTIAILVLMAAILLVGVSIEAAGLLAAYQAAALSRKMSAFSMFAAGIRLTVSEIRKRNLRLFLVLAVHGLVLHSFLIYRMLCHVKAVKFILPALLAENWGRLLLVGVIVGAVVISLPTIFICFGCMLEQRSFRGGFLRSRELLRGNRVQVVGTLVLCNLAVTAVTVVLYLIAVVIVAVFAVWFADRRLELILVLEARDRIEMVLMPLMSIVLMSVNYGALTVLYVQLDRKRQNKERWKFEAGEHAGLPWLSRRNRMAALALLTALSAGAMYDAFYRGNVLAADQLREVQLTAHRGASTSAPENTMPAMEAAVDQMADFAELDVQETRDGVLVLFHDSTLERIDGTRRTIRSLSWDELQQVDAGGWYSEQYSGTRIPKLEDVIEYVRGRMMLNIEIKYAGASSDLPEKVVDCIRENDFAEQCVVTSTSLSYLKRVKAADPDIYTGYILSAAYGSYYEDGAIAFISLISSSANRKLVERVHACGKEVHVWTVNKKSELERMKMIGVDNIITDRPILAREVILGEENAENLLARLRALLR